MSGHTATGTYRSEMHKVLLLRQLVRVPAAHNNVLVGIEIVAVNLIIVLVAGEIRIILIRGVVNRGGSCGGFPQATSTVNVR